MNPLLQQLFVATQPQAPAGPAGPMAGLLAALQGGNIGQSAMRIDGLPPQAGTNELAPRRQHPFDGSDPKFQTKEFKPSLGPNPAAPGRSSGGGMSPLGMAGPGSIITAPFRHLYGQGDIDAYGLQQPQYIYSMGKDGNIITGQQDWWKPGAKVTFGDDGKNPGNGATKHYRFIGGKWQAQGPAGVWQPFNGPKPPGYNGTPKEGETYDF